jgi:hypothetical protein
MLRFPFTSLREKFLIWLALALAQAPQHEAALRLAHFSYREARTLR